MFKTFVSLLSGHASYQLRVYYTRFTATLDDFGGLVVSILATGTRVRGFKPGRSR